MQYRATSAPGVAAVMRAVIVAGAIFFVLTVAAMLLYPGGRVGDVKSVGYDFFTNFFSDLGATQTHGGHDNLVSMVLFCIALVATAGAVALFFIGFARLFAPATGAGRAGIAAAVAGVVAAISFVGVAATPWNLYLRAHNDFVQWAFRAFLVAVVCAAVAGWLAPRFPRRFAAVFATFAVLLAAYIGLITFGPRPATPEGAAIQATGQKIIVYASVLTVLIQAVGVRALLRRR